MMKLQKRSGGFNTEFWAEKIQVTTFSHYPSELTLRLQGDVGEAELCVRWDGEWLIRLVCALLVEILQLKSLEEMSVKEQAVREKEENRSRGKHCPRECYKKKKHSLPKDV